MNKQFRSPRGGFDTSLRYTTDDYHEDLLGNSEQTRYPTITSQGDQAIPPDYKLAASEQRQQFPPNYDENTGFGRNVYTDSKLTDQTQYESYATTNQSTSHDFHSVFFDDQSPPSAQFDGDDTGTLSRPKPASPRPGRRNTNVNNHPCWEQQRTRGKYEWVQETNYGISSTGDGNPEQQHQVPDDSRSLRSNTPEPPQQNIKRRKVEAPGPFEKKLTQRQVRDAAVAARKADKKRAEEQAYRNSLAAQKLTHPGGSKLYRVSNLTKPSTTIHQSPIQYPQPLSHDTACHFNGTLNSLPEHEYRHWSSSHSHTELRNYNPPDGVKPPQSEGSFRPKLSAIPQLPHHGYRPQSGGGLPSNTGYNPVMHGQALPSNCVNYTQSRQPRGNLQPRAQVTTVLSIQNDGKATMMHHDPDNERLLQAPDYSEDLPEDGPRSSPVYQGHQQNISASIHSDAASDALQVFENRINQEQQNLLPRAPESLVYFSPRLPPFNRPIDDELCQASSGFQHIHSDDLSPAQFRALCRYHNLPYPD